MGWNLNFLNSGERILYEGSATKKNFSMAGGAIVGGVTGTALSITNGRLFLTDKRFVFVKHSFMMFGTVVVEEIPLLMVDSVVDVPDKLCLYIQINTKDQKSRVFDIAPLIEDGKLVEGQQSKEKWLKAINDALQSNS